MEKIELGTPDITEENINRLGELFPSVITEVEDGNGEVRKAIDFDALRELLGDVAENGRLRYQFTWPGKSEAKAEAFSPTDKTLRPSVDQSFNWDSTKNLYIEGDNLDALKILKKSYAGLVHVIYIDPPYNTGKDAFVYPDTFSSSNEEYRDLSGEFDEDGYVLTTNLATNGKFHSVWCSMIYQRLLLARDLLAQDGLIFISIGDDEIANLRKIGDEVFGASNFVNCFIWNCSTAGGIRPKYASSTHEYALCYARQKSLLPMFFAPLSSEAVKAYSQRDERGIYRDKDFVFKNKSTNKNQKYGITCPDGSVVFPKPGYIYRFIENRFREALADGYVTFKRSNNGPLVDASGKQAGWNIYIKKYLGDAKGAPGTIVPKENAGLYNTGTQLVQDLFDGVRVFENVKPVAYISWLLGLADKPDGIVLDFFSGSGTTAQAVMEMNAADGGNRQFIMVQIPQECPPDSDAYKNGYPTICEIGKERIRRAGNRLLGIGSSTTQQLSLNVASSKPVDVGFRVLKIGSSNFKIIKCLPSETEQPTLFDFIDNLKENRTDLDLLFEILPRFDIPYSAKIERCELAGKAGYSVEDGMLVACFDSNVGVDAIEAIARMKPVYAVVRDASLIDDATEANFEELFKTYSPNTERFVL